MPYYPEFGRLLSHHLQQQERSASWLAGRLGVHPSTVINWQNGANRPKDPETVIRLADILGIHEAAQRQVLLQAAGYAYISAPAHPQSVESPPQSTDPVTDGPDLDHAETVHPLPPNNLPLDRALPRSDLSSRLQLKSRWQALDGQSRVWLAAVYTRPQPQPKSIWCAMGLVGGGLAVGLSYPLLWEWPLVRLMLADMAALLALILVLWEVRRPGAVTHWLGQVTYGSRLAQLCTLSLLAFSLILWLGVGLPRLYGKWPYRGRDEDGDLYGYALTSGDYDGDGYTNLVVGAPGETPFYQFGGRSGWVYTFKGADYNMLSDLNFGQAGLDFNQDGDRFGWAVATGDFNGDGLVDLAVGAPGKTIGDAVHAGCVYVFKGTRHGLTPWQVIDQHLLGRNESGDQFGWSLAVGDFNRDGKDDLAIGAPYEQPGDNPRSGYVFIFTGDVHNFNQWFGLQQEGITHPQQDARFGWSLAAGDFDHDGRTDLAVGAPGAFYEQDANSITGHVYIFRNVAEQGPVFWQDVAPTRAASVNPLGNRFGTALLAADFNGDHWLDLAVGAPGEPPEAQPTRQVPGYVFLFQNAQKSLVFWQGLNQAPLTTAQNFDLFGWSLAAGDFNHDGRPDLAVGAPGKVIVTGAGKHKSGAVFTFQNNPGKNNTANLAAWQSFVEPELGREQFNDHFGWSLATGNFDHDGSDDLAVGAPGGASNLHWVSGLVYIYRTTVGGLASWFSLFQDMQQ